MYIKTAGRCFLDNAKNSAFDQRHKTNLSGVHARDRQHSVAKQEADEIVCDLAENEIVLRGAGQRQAEGDGKKRTGEEIDCRLVGDQRVDVSAAEIPTCMDQYDENHRVSAHACHTRNKSDHQRRERQRWWSAGKRWQTWYSRRRVLNVPRANFVACIVDRRADRGRHIRRLSKRFSKFRGDDRRRCLVHETQTVQLLRTE